MPSSVRRTIPPQYDDQGETTKMATLVDGNGTIFMVNDNNGQVVEAIATNSDGSSYTMQWDTQTETNWVSRTEWNNAAGQLTQDEVTFRDGSTAWQFFAPDGSVALTLGNAVAMQPNSYQSVFADIISANVTGQNTELGFMAGAGMSSLGGVNVSAFNLQGMLETADITISAAQSKIGGIIGNLINAGQLAYEIYKDLTEPATNPQAGQPNAAPISLPYGASTILERNGLTLNINSYDGHTEISVSPGPGGLLGHV